MIMKQLMFASLLLLAAPLTALVQSCSKSSDSPPTSSGEWLIPQSEVFDGGPGKDGIPSIENPKFTVASSVDFLLPDDLVLGIKVGEDIRAYPHPILDWHEIVNDEIGGLPLAITYCPLTGTGIGWVRRVNGKTTTFGVSGLLYNANLLPYDRATDSNWSQILLKGVNGELMGEDIETYPMMETSWASWKAMFPDSKVLNTQTGFSRNYGNYPYGSYRTNHDLLIFPISPDDTRLPRKERGLGVIFDGEAKFYPLAKFESVTAVHQDAFRGRELVVVGSQTQNFLAAYERRLPDGTLLEFEALSQSGTPVVMQDQEGNRWNVFGEAVSGPRAGTKLLPTQSFIGYWFSWGAFYPRVEIF